MDIAFVDAAGGTVIEASEYSWRLSVPCNPSSTVTDVRDTDCNCNFCNCFCSIIIILEKMSSSPTFIMNPTRGEEEEEMLAIDPGRSHTPPPGSRPNSRLEILIMDMARSTEQRLESFARAQSEKLDGLAKGQADLAHAQIGHVAELANIMGRLSSLEV